jgi:hypothetical protein
MTRGSGLIIHEQYTGTDHFERSCSLVVVDGSDLDLGMTEATLAEPIDYDAEIAERRDTHEPITPVDGNLANSVFGI